MADAARFRRTPRPTDGCRARVPGHTGSQEIHRLGRRRASLPSADAGARRGHYPRPVTSAQQPPGGATAEGAAYADRFAAETPEMVAARERAVHLSGPPPVEPAVGATLAVLASTVGARLGRVDRQRWRGGRAVAAARHAPRRRPHRPGRRPRAAARRAAGVRRGRHRRRPRAADLRDPGRGAAPAVARRLRHGRLRRARRGSTPSTWPACSTWCGSAARWSATGCSRDGRIADRTARDPQTVAWREITRTIRDDETLLSAVLPIGADCWSPPSGPDVDSAPQVDRPSVLGPP